MRLKSFHAPTMSEAMRQVREALGEDAIIVATREEDGGGVRVTAAVEDDDPGFAFGVSTEPEPDDDLVEAVTEVMLRHNAPPAVTDRLIPRLTRIDAGDAAEALAEALDAVFGFAPLKLAGRKLPKPFMLVGPPGCGKTLALAKLATQAVLSGLKPVVFTTDNTRAGGDRQLAALMQVLGVDLMVVDDAPSLPDAVAAFGTADLTLIDTAGRKPFDLADMEELVELVHTAGGVEPILVIAAGGDPAEAAEVGAIFQEIGVRRMIATQLDVSRRLGGVLAAAEAGNLEIAGASNTWNPAEPLVALNADQLAHWLMEDAKQERRPVPRTAAGRRTGTGR